MIKTSLIKRLSLIFGILCAVGLAICLMCAIDLPTKVTYRTIYGAVTKVTYGQFHLEYLSSVILLAMGTFVGFSVFSSIQIEKKPSDKIRTEENECLSDSTEASEPAEEPTKDSDEETSLGANL